MTTLNTMKTMADVIRVIETEELFTPAFKKKVLGSVRRMKRLPQYGEPLDLIDADLDAFNRTWGRGPVRKIPAGFKSTSSFSNWRSQVRSALTAALDIAPSARADRPNDEWTQLISDLLSAGVQEKRLIAVSVLAGAARKASLKPGAISRSWVQDIVDSADTSGRYRSIQAAARLIHQHSEASTVALSPAFDGHPIRKSRSHCTRAALPNPLAMEIQTWEHRRVEGEPRGHRRKRKSACSPARAKQALSGVTYVYTAMLEAGFVSREEPWSSRDLTDPTWLEEVIERELNGEFPWAPLKRTTLFEYVNNWKLFLKGCGHDPKPLTEVIGDFSEFENVKSMSEGRRAWCEGFLHDHHQQSALLSLPGHLFREAEKAMAGYDTASHHQKKAAIALGIAACAAAIWTSLPLRISTLLRLSYGGPKADVQIHSSRRGLVLTTPPDIVKNGYSHRYITLTPKRGGNPREIVAWFVETVRPRLLEAHVGSHLRRRDHLFGGVSYARLSSIWRQATLEAGVPMTPHQVRHALATLMANQPGADYSIIAALLGDTETTVRKNYVFVDQARKHEEGQKLLAQIQGNVLMRGAA